MVRCPSIIGWATTFNRLFAFDNACPEEVSSEEESLISRKFLAIPSGYLSIIIIIGRLANEEARMVVVNRWPVSEALP